MILHEVDCLVDPSAPEHTCDCGATNLIVDVPDWRDDADKDADLTADTITDEQILELRRETFARWNTGVFVGPAGENLNEQLQVETAALHPDGGIIGPPHYHARRITQRDARTWCAKIFNARRSP